MCIQNLVEICPFIPAGAGGGGGGRVGWGQGGCERRIEVFVKIQKNGGGGGAKN